MSTASQWRLYEDAMNKAQAVLVNFQHQLSLSSYWGDGTTSSSEELLSHISPLGWEHVNFLGEYAFKPEISISIHSLRPLRT